MITTRTDQALPVQKQEGSEAENPLEPSQVRVNLNGSGKQGAIEVTMPGPAQAKGLKEHSEEHRKPITDKSAGDQPRLR